MICYDYLPTARAPHQVSTEAPGKELGGIKCTNVRSPARKQRLQIIDDQRRILSVMPPIVATAVAGYGMYYRKLWMTI